MTESADSTAPLMVWPPTPEHVRYLIARGETDLVEFKREWHDLDSRVSRGRFARHVLALANSVTIGRAGFLIYGVDDPRIGSAVVGVDAHPAADAITGALKLLTQPMVDVQYVPVEVSGASVGVLGVFPSRYHPHWATRDVDGELSSTVFYVRKGASVAYATPPEVEGFFREKDGRLGGALTLTGSAPIEAGFVEGGGWRTTHQAVLRIVNVSEEPVPAVQVVVDVRLPMHPDVFARMRQWSTAQLGPGESKECEIRIDPTTMYRGTQYVGPAANNTLHYHWADLTAHVVYRDRAGFLQRLTREHVLAD